MSLDSQALLEALETERQTRIRRRGQEALYQSLVIGGFGVLGYTTCWIYSVLSGATNQIREMAEDLFVGQAVHPTVFSEEGYAVLVEHYEVSKGWKWWNVMRFESEWETARRHFEASGGVVKALPHAVERVARWEKILIAEGSIPVEEAVATAPGALHPVDRVTGWILNNRETYFGVVMAAMAAPVVPVLAEVARNAKG